MRRPAVIPRACCECCDCASAGADIASDATVCALTASRENKMTGTRSNDLQQKFEEWYVHFQHEKFWEWLEESDDATHFKSKENLNFWSERLSQEHRNFLRTVWVEYGCPGHGKSPWDGLGATAKTKVTQISPMGTKGLRQARLRVLSLSRSIFEPYSTRRSGCQYI